MCNSISVNAYTVLFLSPVKMPSSSHCTDNIHVICRSIYTPHIFPKALLQRVSGNNSKQVTYLLIKIATGVLPRTCVSSNLATKTIKCNRQMERQTNGWALGQQTMVK